MNYIYNLPKYFKPKFQFDLVRLGRNNDGGYLVGEKTIKATKTLISLGINDDWSFEKDFEKKKTYLKTLMYDDNLNFFFLLKNFFFKKGLKLKITALRNLYYFILFDQKKMFKIKINKYNFIPIIKKFKNIFLKIDIEGDEYQLLKDIIKYKNRVVGLSIEFHSVDIKIEKIVSFIKDLDFKITNIHINNYVNYGKDLIPRVVEMTLEKNPKIIKYSYLKESNLNQKNNIYGKEINISFK